MPDRRLAPGMRWTGAIPVCMLVWSCASTPASKEVAEQSAAKTAPAPEFVSTLAGVYTDEQAERGRAFYLGMCKSCHAPESHTGAAFSKNWKGKRLSDLFVFIKRQMPQNDPGSLDPGDVADVLAYILKLNAEPTGKDELDGDANSLEKFRIDVKQAGTTTEERKTP